MPAVTLPTQITIGSFFLETLTTGMYENPLHCLREYVQNSFDAIHDAVGAQLIGADDGKVMVSVTAVGARQNISIRDNGAGAPTTEAVERFVSLGASHKRPAKHAGFRGIGRLAGIAYCTTLKFTTKAAGEALATVLSFDCAKLRGLMAPGAEPRGVSDVIRASVTAQTVAAPATQHYTEVEMQGLIYAGLEFTDRDKLVAYLSQYSPVDYAGTFPFADQIRAHAASLGQPLPVIEVELKIKKERLRITKPFRKSYAPPPDGSTRPAPPSILTGIELVESPEHGWFGWFGISNFPGTIPDASVAGIRFRQKNIQIGDATIIESIAGTVRANAAKGSDRTLQRWAVGEIFITNTSVVPNARRDGFEDNDAWQTIRTDANAVTQSLVKIIRSSSKKRNLLNKATKAIADERARLRQPGFGKDEAQRQKVDQELVAQLAAIEKALKQGADPKEAAELVSQIKELRESLLELAKPKGDSQPSQQPPSSPPSPPSPSSPPAPSSPSGPDEGADGTEADEISLLALVREILVEKLGKAHAAEIMDAVYARLDYRQSRPPTG